MDRERPIDVLVVDDDRHIRDVIAELLEDEGYVVGSAANGEEALHILRRPALPYVILLDIMMPKMNGWEFREVQRHDPAIAHIPVVTISAHADLLNPASQLEGTEHLSKPLDIDRLLAIVRRYCVPRSAG